MFDPSLIEVKFDWEGFHRWPEAPEEVAFLRDRHRHLFVARACIEVSHDDRDLEFILVKRFLQDYARTNMVELGSTSCEMMCKTFIHLILDNYGDRNILVTVHEDDENGAVVGWTKEPVL